MTAETLIAALYVFALAAFLGYQVISRVPPLLHTPLMSATNAISGISLVGSIVTAGAGYNTVSTILGFTAVFCSATNVVGGFVITDRMLRMFKRKPTDKEIGLWSWAFGLRILNLVLCTSFPDFVFKDQSQKRQSPKPKFKVQSSKSKAQSSKTQD